MNKFVLFKLLVIEQIDHSASMYGSTIKDHSICLLLKILVSILLIGFFKIF